MNIESVTIEGLFGKPRITELLLHSDLNIMTGRNGSGKTSIMKLVWLIMSGNILLALQEVNFASCNIKTSKYNCLVTRTGSLHCRVEIEHDGEKYVFEDDPGEPDGESWYESAEDKANPILMSKGGSIFFPTFRRIEGGFSLNARRPITNRSVLRPETEIDESLSSLSKRLSNESHLFVSAISTRDIVSLLLRQYAEFSEKVNQYQEEVSRSVIERIKHYEQSQNITRNADFLLSETRGEIEKIETYRLDTMRPLNAVRELVEQLFQHSGIRFDRRLSFGDAAEAVNSDVLSSGEKQLLSFICYNAFYKNTVVFVDEPELSLHVDWQRQLYSILLSQGSGNQYIFSTHSPFIYSKYPDKEVQISSDRGD